MGSEDLVLKGTKLITNMKKQRLKIQSRGQTLKKYSIKKNNKSYKYIYMKLSLKIVFFCKVIIGYKNEN